MDMRTLRCWMNMDESRSMDSKTSENQSYQNMFHSNIYQWDHLRCHATGAPAQMVRKATRVERTSATAHSWWKVGWKAGWKAEISCSSSQRWRFPCHICHLSPVSIEVILSATLDFDGMFDLSPNAWPGDPSHIPIQYGFVPKKWGNPRSTG